MKRIDWELSEMMKRVSLVYGEMVIPCWNWMGNINIYGYGRVSLNAKPILAHRAFYEKFVHPPTKHLHHMCRNKRCCNPMHMLEIDPVDHPKLDADSRTHCKRQHEFTPENTRIRANGGRECNICRKNARRMYNHKQKALHNL